jgi:hypothetical protein
LAGRVPWPTWLNKESPSFLKKRSKRLLSLRSLMDTGLALDRGRRGELKVFWFFFSKKNAFLSPLPSRDPSL